MINFLLNSSYSKVFHVRSVTHGDVIRADPKDIPRIFQVGSKTGMPYFSSQTYLLSF